MVCHFEMEGNVLKVTLSGRIYSREEETTAAFSLLA